MRPVHAILGGILLAAAAVAWVERRPNVADYDPRDHAEFRDTWDRRVHISYWEKWGSFEAEACQAMVDDFNRSQDEIFVHYLRTSQVDRKSLLAIVGDDPPDVVGLWATNVAPFAEGGALMPLDEFMAASGLTEKHYVLNYLMLGRYKGVTYALPTTPSSVALFCNREHFAAKADALRARGLDPDGAPRTTDELDRYADVLNEFNPDGTPRIMGFLPTEPGWFHSSWVYYFGGSLMDEASDRVTTDLPQNVRAYQWLKGYAERYGRERLLQFRAGFGTFDSPQNAFIDGKVSMVMHGVWFPSFISRHRPHLKYVAVPFPCAPGVPGPRSVLDADVIAIPRGCRHLPQARKFLHYVQTRGLPILCRLQGKHLPIVPPREVLDDFHQGHPNPFLHVFEQVAASPYSFRLPRNMVWQEYQDGLNRAFEHIWNWPAPEEPLRGLSGGDRQRKLDELCRQEIVRTLAELRGRMQRQLDDRQRRSAQRAQRALP